MAAGNGSHLFHSTAAALAALALGCASAQPAPRCDGPEARQFDFWVGEWQVFDFASGKPAGMSRIEKLYGGCVLRENWTSDGFQGGSLNTWWNGDKQWHQVWMDQAGALRHFVGGLADGRMVLVARQPDPKDATRTLLVRLSFTPIADGTVRQYSDTSSDGGTSWRARYDFLYRRIQ
ncbi:MAG TPA: hypothetical protein VIE63_13715 [Ramlibacter sp.]|jgi:hypothetical protein